MGHRLFSGIYKVEFNNTILKKRTGCFAIMKLFPFITYCFIKILLVNSLLISFSALCIAFHCLPL